MRSLPLYDEALLARARRPAGAGTLLRPSAQGRAENPLCGDAIDLDVRAVDGRIEELAHRTKGCALVTASASLLAETSSEATETEALVRAAALRAWLSGDGPLPAELTPLQVVRIFPSRRRCVLLPWEALASALSRPAATAR